MPAEFWTWEAANIFAGDESPDSTNHLSITDVKLPSLTENYSSHAAGGAPVEIEIDTILAHLECNFTLAGWTPQVATLIGSWTRAQMSYTIYAMIRDRRTGEELEGRATLFGRLGQANPANWNRGGMQSWEYAIRGITRYELFFNGERMYEWDFFLNTLIVGTENRYARTNAILRVPTGQVAPTAEIPT